MGRDDQAMPSAARGGLVVVPGGEVAHGGKLIDFPDFTRGRWKTTAPLPVYGA